jgi:hypothetical protein
MRQHDGPKGRRSFEKMTETTSHENRRESRIGLKEPMAFEMGWRFENVIEKFAAS